MEKTCQILQLNKWSQRITVKKMTKHLTEIRLSPRLHGNTLTALLPSNDTLISPTNEPHLESFPHNLHSLIPFMRSEARTFMVGRYISPSLPVSPLSCMVMDASADALAIINIGDTRRGGEMYLPTMKVRASLRMKGMRE